MHLVEVLLRAHFKTKCHGDNGKHIDKYQFREISFEADNKGHYQKIREIEQVFSCLQPLYIVHNNQVKVQVHNGQDASQLKFSSLVKVKSKNKKISRAKINERTNVKSI